MVAESALEYAGLFGLLLVLLAHLAYSWYTNNRGVIADMEEEIEHLDERLDGVAIIQYRHAKELSGVDEEDVRDRLFNGEQVMFPSDFNQRQEGNANLEPDGSGKHVWVATTGEHEDEDETL